MFCSKERCVKGGQRVRNSSLWVIIFFPGFSFRLQKPFYLVFNTLVATAVLLKADYAVKKALKGTLYEGLTMQIISFWPQLAVSGSTLV